MTPEDGDLIATRQEAQLCVIGLGLSALSPLVFLTAIPVSLVFQRTEWNRAIYGGRGPRGICQFSSRWAVVGRTVECPAPASTRRISAFSGTSLHALA
jgi:hypothetical protein